VTGIPPLTPGFAQQPPPLIGLNVQWDEDWIPEGDQYGVELMPGNQISITVFFNFPTFPPPPYRQSIWLEMSCSSIMGSCTNAGTMQLPDFAILDSQNDPDWGFLPGFDVPQYTPAMYHANIGSPAMLATIAESRLLYNNEPVTLIVRSFDWGGRCTLRFSTMNASDVTIDIPRDQDMDSMPDVLEQGQDAVSSRDEDYDVDAEGVHVDLGDVIGAFDEYRGFRKEGEVFRMSEMIDNGPLGQEGGPKKKDVVLYADTDGAAGGLGSLFPEPAGGNPYLRDYNVGFRKFIAADVIAPTAAEGGDAGWIKTDAATPRQRAVWIKAENLPGATLGFGTGPISAGVSLKIDVQAIKDIADSWEVPRATILQMTVAHELGHVFALDHDKAERAYVAAQPAVNRTDYWRVVADATNRTVDFWVPARFKVLANSDEIYGELEEVTGLATAGENTITTDDGITGRLEGAGVTIAIHGAAHRVGRYRLIFSAAVPAGTPMKIKVDAHEGHLMDPVFDPGELAGCQMNLKAAHKAAIKVR
jgi:hypothetical protein